MRYQPPTVCAACASPVAPAASPAIKELREVCYMLREVLATYEAKLSDVVVETAEGSGQARVHSPDQPTRPRASRLEMLTDSPPVVTPRK
jgi:hypothetical protein